MMTDVQRSKALQRDATYRKLNDGFEDGYTWRGKPLN